MPPELSALSREDLAEIIVTQRGERTVLCTERDALCTERDALCTERDALKVELVSARAEAAELQTKLDYVAKQLFRPSSEQRAYAECDGVQQTFLGTPVEAVVEAPASTTTVPAHTRATRGHGRRPVSRDLPTHEQIIPAAEADKVGADGEPLALLGYEISEKLDIVPGVLRRLIIKREKWGTPDTRETLHVAPVPPSLIPKGKASDAFVLDVICKKYALGLPLYRQLGDLNARGADVNAAWLSDLIKQAAAVFAPVYDALRQHLLRQRLLYADETPIRQLRPASQRSTADGADDDPRTVRTSYYWAWLGDDHCYIHFDPTRSQSAIRTVLNIPDDTVWDPGGCIALLMCDGYAGYNIIDTAPLANEQHRITRVACWAHVRRRFLACADLGDDNAKHLIDAIDRLFSCDRTIRKANARAQRLGADAHAYTHAERQLHAAPIIADIRQQIDRYRPHYTPARDMAKHIAYTLNLWRNLTVFLDHGDVPLDNNTAERAIRPLAVGRKNWLFVGSEDAGTWSAIFFSLIESCRLQHIDPRRYLEHITPHLTSREPIDHATLIPGAVKAQLPAR
jgi:transposase